MPPLTAAFSRIAVYGALLLAAPSAAVPQIYSSDHWSYVTKLTQDTLDLEIAGHIFRGKTIFVRFIPSPGCGCCRKQAPAWDSITRAAAEEQDVVFGDFDMAANQDFSDTDIGVGGWPMVRYYNARTGAKGRPYVQKTDRSMCDELAEESYMKAYVEEAADILLCDTVTGQKCSAKETAYIAKMGGKSPEELGSQLERLVGMEGSSMTPDLRSWLVTRKKILKNLSATLSAKLNDEL
eukprot:CAMPEP_0194310964 /NCGR_PEP_ID=MMETSP0171-20130528/7944_1 /TAXON_ID=218684 /ORGANISM="Corethron pennatum, Strain L29A3" /LENGTH=236 /DNA_ID=CAMNT_0039064849 /DNA_START=12 /DNA_END=722 /DNA_ORIENTATION=-